MPGRWRGRAPMPGRNVMLESTSGTCAFEAGNRHQPFFGCCPRGVPRGVPLNPGVTTGLKEAILEFFSWEPLGAGSAGLLWASQY